MDKQSKSFQVVIIGAGSAGIGAATVLKKFNISFVLLQARNRIGGRTLTLQLDGVPIDHGACWIHNYGKDNPMHSFVQKHQIQQAKAFIPKRDKEAIFIDGEKGEEFSQRVLEVGLNTANQFFQSIKKSKMEYKEDFSVQQAARSFILYTINKLSPQQKRCCEVIINMNQTYEASALSQLSALQFSHLMNEDADFMPQGGYGSFLKKIAASQKIEFQLNKVVEEIIYEEGAVKVICNDGTSYFAKKVISSLPLGILKAQKVKFNPQLPIQYRQSINRLGFGLMNKLIVSFQEKFWPSTEWLSIGFDERGRFSHILNLSTSQKNILCCFMVSNFAKKMENLPDQIILEEYLSFLKKIFHKEQIKIREYVITRWGKQEYSLGSYSSFHVGSSVTDCHLLRTPIRNTLWMVGEYCHPQNIGTAYGAFNTGLLAAQEVVESLKIAMQRGSRQKRVIFKKEQLLLIFYFDQIFLFFQLFSMKIQTRHLSILQKIAQRLNCQVLLTKI